MTDEERDLAHVALCTGTLDEYFRRRVEDEVIRPMIERAIRVVLRIFGVR